MRSGGVIELSKSYEAFFLYWYNFYTFVRRLNLQFESSMGLPAACEVTAQNP